MKTSLAARVDHRARPPAPPAASASSVETPATGTSSASASAARGDEADAQAGVAPRPGADAIASTSAGAERRPPAAAPRRRPSTRRPATSARRARRRRGRARTSPRPWPCRTRGSARCETVASQGLFGRSRARISRRSPPAMPQAHRTRAGAAGRRPPPRATRRRRSRRRSTARGHPTRRREQLDVEAVEVEMRDVGPRVAVPDRVGRARDGPVDPERAARRRGRRSSCPPRARPRRRRRRRARAAGEPGGDALGLLGRGRLELERHESEEAELLDLGRARGGAAAATEAGASTGACGRRTLPRMARRAAPGCARSPPRASSASPACRAPQPGGRSGRASPAVRRRDAVLRRPCTRVIPAGLPERSFVAKFPSVATSFGSISSSWRNRWRSQASISSGCGSRFPGGRHLSTTPPTLRSCAFPRRRYRRTSCRSGHDR